VKRDRSKKKHRQKKSITIDMQYCTKTVPAQTRRREGNRKGKRLNRGWRERERQRG
jgi:hypothetical protein